MADDDGIERIPINQLRQEDGALTRYALAISQVRHCQKADAGASAFEHFASCR
jgi:hypothetical protein